MKRRIIDEITTNETLFFRDSAPFDLLRFKIIPEIIDRRAKSGQAVTPIRIWSAACSTGQEIYSIAIVLRELLGDLRGYNVRLLGTDISDQAVARASEAIFSQIEIDRGLTAAARDKSFVAHPKGWKIRDEIRAMVSFRKLNLMDDFSSLGNFDIIFCRNVAIYFNERDRASLFNRIEQRMDGNGYLVIGSMESLSTISPAVRIQAAPAIGVLPAQERGGCQDLDLSPRVKFKARHTCPMSISGPVVEVWVLGRRGSLC